MPDWTGIQLNFPDWLDRWTDDPGGNGGNPEDEAGAGGSEFRDRHPNSGGGDVPPVQNPDGMAPPGAPGLATGGRVTRSGVAEVHRGELVSDPDRLVSELATAIGDAAGGGRQAPPDVDMSSVESKLDRLHRDLRDLSRAMSGLSINVDGETLGRVSNDARRNRINDTDPTV